MVAKKRYSFFITETQAAALKELKDRTGSAEGELIRQALNEFLERKGVMKADRKRAETRKRS
jgi:hypothetical protein